MYPTALRAGGRPPAVFHPRLPLALGRAARACAAARIRPPFRRLHQGSVSDMPGYMSIAYFPPPPPC